MRRLASSSATAFRAFEALSGACSTSASSSSSCGSSSWASSVTSGAASLASSSSTLGRRCTSGVAGRGGNSNLSLSPLQRRHKAAQPAALRSEGEAAGDAAAEAVTSSGGGSAASAAASSEQASMAAAEAAAAAAASSALTRPFSELEKQTNVRERLLLNLYLLRGHAHQRAAAAAAAARGRLRQGAVAAEAAAPVGGAEGTAAAAAAAPPITSRRPRAAADSSAESMLFAPISHMLDGFVAAAARGAEEAAAKAAAAAAKAEAEAEAEASAPDTAAASDGARAAAAETAALWTRQLTNERRSLEAARARYSADLVQLAELGICSSAAAPRKVQQRLYLPMVEAVREEQIRVLSGVPGTDRRHYGPFLLLLPPEDYAALALQGVLTETLRLGAKSFRGNKGGVGVGVGGGNDGGGNGGNVGLKGGLGRAAAREPGFAPFTGLARGLGRGVRDTVALGRLEAVVRRETTRQETLVRLWESARKLVAARGPGGLTPGDERELLEEFARVGPSTASYLEEEEGGGGGLPSSPSADKKKNRRKKKQPLEMNPKGRKAYVRYSAVDGGGAVAAGLSGPRGSPAAGTLHDKVIARIEELKEEITRRRREEHLRELRRRHSEEMARYKESLRQLGLSESGGESSNGSSLLSPVPPPPPFPKVRRVDYLPTHDLSRIEGFKTRALQAVDNVSAWTKDDAVKVGGALCHLLVEAATVEVPVPDAAAAAAIANGGGDFGGGGVGGGGSPFVEDMPLPVMSPLNLSEGEEEEEDNDEEGDAAAKQEARGEGREDEGKPGGGEKEGAGEEEEEAAAAGESHAGVVSAKAKTKAKAKAKKPHKAKFKPIETRGAGEVVVRRGRHFRVEPAFVRSRVRGGGKQVGGLVAHPQVLADAFRRGGIDEQEDEVAAAAVEEREQQKQQRQLAEAGAGTDKGRGAGGGEKAAGGGGAVGKDHLLASTTSSFLGPFAAERGALGLVSDVQLPMLVPPVPWRSHNEGGYLVSRSSAVRCKGRGLQRRLLAAADDAPPAGLSRVYAGLNALGALPWRINAEVLEAVERSIEREGGGFALIPPTRDEPLPQRSWRLARRPPTAFASAMTAAEALAGGGDRLPPYLIFTGAEFPQEVTARRRAAAAAKKRNREAHAARCDLGLKLAVAREFARGNGNGNGGDAIYYPHNLDFRGRAYPMHPHLNHLGNDVCRGLLTFGDSLELGKEGYDWLLVQVANSFGKGADKLPLEERRAFAEERLGALLATADDPWGDDPRKWKKQARSCVSSTGGRRYRKKKRYAHFGSGGDPADAADPRWWLEADAPWQLLATAKELRDAHRAHPGEPWRFRSRLPVRVDGTCNGLQHYAALGRDEDGARAVNLLPSDRPSDVYSDVAAVVRRRVERDAANPGSVGAKRARAARLLLAAGVDRGLVKQTVMTSVYGVTFVGAREQVASRLRERGFYPGSDNVAAALGSSGGGGDTPSSQSTAASFSPHDDLGGNPCFEASSYGAQVTFDALAELFGGARAIMQWLGDCAALVAGRDRAMAWTTPLGFPVAQPYRKRQLRVVQTAFQRLILDDEAHSAEQPISMPEAGRMMGGGGGGGAGGGDGEKEEERREEAREKRGGGWWVPDGGEEGEDEEEAVSSAASASASSSSFSAPGPAASGEGEQQLQQQQHQNDPFASRPSTSSPSSKKSSSKVNKRRQRTAFPPNFIHALDSTHMLSTAARAREAGVAFAGVHDSFWTHAGTVPRLNEMLRDAFVELHSRPLLEDLLAQLRAAHPDISFPPLPARGELDLEKVRQSTYFFS